MWIALLAYKQETSQALAHLALEALSHKTTQIWVFLVLGTSAAASLVSENSICCLAFCSDTSDEQNSQSSMENSVNSSEKVERQPSAESGSAAEPSAVSQVPAARPPWGGAGLLRGMLKGTPERWSSIEQQLKV